MHKAENGSESQIELNSNMDYHMGHFQYDLVAVVYIWMCLGLFFSITDSRLY